MPLQDVYGPDDSVTKKDVTSTDQLEEVWETITGDRTTEKTAANETSSRTHLFVNVVTVKKVKGGEEVKGGMVRGPTSFCGAALR